MGKKRSHDEFEASQRVSNRSEDSQVDPRYGQRYAIPGLDDSDVASGDEISIEAIKYLRSVRAEANGIPGLLVASIDPEVEHSELTNTGGVYVDGAYIATPTPNGNDHNDSDFDISDVEVDNQRDEDDKAERSRDLPFKRMIKAQDGYHSALLRRYNADQLLRRESPLDLVKALKHETHPIYVELDIPAAVEGAKWNYIFQNTSPKSSQLNSMSHETVIELLRRLIPIFKRKKWVFEGGKSGQNMSIWIWSLLGRLPELGTMSSEEVAIVRDLGKRAISIIAGLDRNEDLEWGNEEDEAAQENDEENDGIERKAELSTSMESHVSNRVAESQEAVDAARSKLLSTITLGEEEAADMIDHNRMDAAHPLYQLTSEDHMMATLDMIITIVGECYGQRDLLVARDRLWN